MRIAIAGTDYVGVPNAVLLAQINELVAIGIVPKKVAMLGRKALPPRYFRPTEVDIRPGDTSKAKQKLGWASRTSFDELVKRHGYKAMDYKE